MRRELLAPLLLGVVLLVGWILTAGQGSVLLPTPGKVAARLVSDLTDPVYWSYLLVTLGEAFGGALLGTAVALPLAVLIHRSRWVAAAVNPFLGATQAIPAIALAPLLVLWLGYGLGPVIILCALIVFFPILISAVVGLRHVDADVVDAGRIDGASSLALLVNVELPMALPSILGGVRNGVTLAVTGAIVGEMVMGGAGLGTVLTIQRESVDTAGMVSTIIVLCVIASAAYAAIHLWERHSRIIDSLHRS
ncbi:MAG: ABC transporter permease [Propionicimonas sp.]|uniref:ABC transporter permease n=1 Tax=Propionicimonas sp. TaxID=1955623 RepID=UPI003D0D8C31